MAGDRDRNEGDDPLELVNLDEAFVRAATIVELSAEERIELLGLAPLDPASESLFSIEECSGSSRWIRKRQRRIRWAALLALGALLGSTLWMLLTLSLQRVREVDAWSDLHWVMPVEVEDTPTDSIATDPRRLVDRVEPPDGEGGFEVEQWQSDGRTPVGFDPCKPVRWAVGGPEPSAEEDRLISGGFDELAAATGLVFVREQGAGETPRADRDAVQPERYGDRWAPVLVSFSTPARTVALEGRVAAVTVSRSVEYDGSRWLVSGSVILDSGQIAEMPTRAARRRVVLHALGHLLGLDDVTDSEQLMYPGATGPTELGSGDRRGLALLGDGACAGS